MPPKSQPRHTLSYQLRDIIESRGLSAYAAARLADVDPGVVSRFLSGRRDIRLETADRLALALGLRLTEMARWTGGRGRPAKKLRRVGTPPIPVTPPACQDEADSPDLAGLEGEG